MRRASLPGHLGSDQARRVRIVHRRLRERLRGRLHVACGACGLGEAKPQRRLRAPYGGS